MKMKDVIISIKGTQNDADGEDSEIELVTDGQFSFENGEGVFSYMESELTGLEGTKTSFTISPLGVVLSRGEGVPHAGGCTALRRCHRGRLNRQRRALRLADVEHRDQHEPHLPPVIHLLLIGVGRGVVRRSVVRPRRGRPAATWRPDPQRRAAPLRPATNLPPLVGAHHHRCIRKLADQEQLVTHAVLR